MGKTVTAKWEDLSKALNCKPDFLSLSKEISNQIINAENYSPRVNSISYHTLSSFAQARANINIKSSNWTTYKQNGMDFLAEVSKILNLKLTSENRAPYAFKNINGKLSIEFDICAGDYVNKAMYSPLPLNNQYNYWRKHEAKKFVGSKKYWPTEKIINELKSSGLYDIEWPTSHPRPAQLSRILKEKHLLPIIKKSCGNKEKFHQEVLKLCRNDSERTSIENNLIQQGKKTGKINITYVSSFSAHLRHVPYFYIKEIDASTGKIGKATLTPDRLKDSDSGMLVQLIHHDSVDIALKFEDEFREWLSRLEIYPIKKKLDYFDLTANDLIKLSLQFQEEKPEMLTSVKSIYLTH